MPRVQHSDFRKGLFLSGDRDAVPQGFVRRNLGTRTPLAPSIRSRFGAIERASGFPTSLKQPVRFDDQRYVQVAGDLYRIVGATGTTVFGNGLVFASFYQRAFRYAKGIPTIDTRRDVTTFPRGPEHLYVLGGGANVEGLIDPIGRAFKLDTNFQPTPIGLPPPPDTWQVAVDRTEYAQVIDDFTVVRWGPLATGIVFYDSAVSRIGQSLAVGVVAETTKSVYARSPVSNLSVFIANGDTIFAAEDDWIELWVYCDEPKNLDSIEIVFDITPTALTDADIPLEDTSTSKITDAYIYMATVEDSVVEADLEGTADLPALSDKREKPWYADIPKRDRIYGRGGVYDRRANERERTQPNATDVARAASSALVDTLAQTKLSNTANTWTRLRIPKRSFTKVGRAGTTGAPGFYWSSVRRLILRATANKNGDVNLRFDSFQQRVGIGTAGEYQFALTYYNDKTGVRSNPGAIKKAPGRSDREPFIISNLNAQGGSVAHFVPPPMATHIEEWRSFGNGSILFLAQQVPWAKVQSDGYLFKDFVSDYIGVQDPSAAFVNPNGTGIPTTYLQQIELPYDNIQPPKSVIDMLIAPTGRAFYLDGLKAERNKMLYSAPGRLEGIEGFIYFGGVDDPLQRMFWLNQLYVFSEAGCFAVNGDGPFTADKVLGVPGTRCPLAIVVSPYGCLYLADDGPRVFNGVTSELIAPEAILPIFQDFAAIGSTPPFIGRSENVIGEYRNDEYFLSDLLDNVTLAINLRTRAWRHVSGTVTGWHTERDTNVLLATTVDGKLVEWEKPGIYQDADVPITFDVEVPGTVLEDQSGITKIVQRVYFDLNTSSQSLTPTLNLGDGGTVTLPTVSTASRQIVEYAQLVHGDIVSVRLTGSLVQPVEIFSVGYDVHLPETGGQRT